MSYAVGLAGKPIGCVKNAYGSYTVVIDDCGSGSSGGQTATGSSPDPISAGTIKSISLGYTLGI